MILASLLAAACLPVVPKRDRRRPVMHASLSALEVAMLEVRTCARAGLTAKSLAEQAALVRADAPELLAAGSPPTGRIA